MQKKPGTRDTLPQINVHEADYALDLDDTVAATRFADESKPTSVRRPRSESVPRLLLARSDETIGPLLAPLQDVMGAADIEEVTDGHQLDASLRNRGPYALVISQAILPGMRGLEVLAKARERGDNTPFVLIQSIHQNFVRITIGGGHNSIVSTRLVNTVALLDLVEQMISKKPDMPPVPT
jgi:CheY-like chemotaxis protein